MALGILLEVGAKHGNSDENWRYESVQSLLGLGVQVTMLSIVVSEE